MKLYSLKEEIEFSHKRYILEDRILKTIIAKGYKCIEPIGFEDYDEFAKENSRQNITETIKILSNDGKINILASDLTNTLISDIKKRGDESEILKLVYQGNTFKNTKQGIKSFRKIGAEYIGDKSIESDIEILRLVVEILELIGEEYVLEISHSSFLNNILDKYKGDKVLYAEIFEALKQRNTDKLTQLLKAENELEAETLIKNIFEFNGSINKLEDSRIIFDMAMVSDQEYYSGIIFKAYTKNSNAAVLKGGRYSITSNFEGIGFSVEIDNLNKIIANLN